MDTLITVMVTSNGTH